MAFALNSFAHRKRKRCSLWDALSGNATISDEYK